LDERELSKIDFWRNVTVLLFYRHAAAIRNGYHSRAFGVWPMRKSSVFSSLSFRKFAAIQSRNSKYTLGSPNTTEIVKTVKYNGVAVEYNGVAVAVKYNGVVVKYNGVA